MSRVVGHEQAHGYGYGYGYAERLLSDGAVGAVLNLTGRMDRSAGESVALAVTASTVHQAGLR